MQWYEGAGQTSAVKDLRKGLPFLPSTQSTEERRALETEEQGSYPPGRAYQPRAWFLVMLPGRIGCISYVDFMQTFSFPFILSPDAEVHVMA